jgi:hypothetical protein
MRRAMKEIFAKVPTTSISWISWRVLPQPEDASEKDVYMKTEASK